MANFIPSFEYEHPTLGTTTITLTLPPERDNQNRRKRVDGRETRSNSGQDQFQFNYTDESFQLRLVFLTQAQLDAIETLYDVLAFSGGSFKYFESNDEAAFETVVLERKDFRPRRVIREGSEFIYDLDMRLRVKIT